MNTESTILNLETSMAVCTPQVDAATRAVGTEVGPASAAIGVTVKAVSPFN
jgi:hypothetical protein